MKAKLASVGLAVLLTAGALATPYLFNYDLAFLIVPMVGAFFIDITNAFIIQAYLALPIFGF